MCMHLNYMSGNNQILTEIWVDEDHNVSIVNHTTKNIDRAFGCNEAPSYDDFINFVKSRSIPLNRNEYEHELSVRGINTSDPLSVVKALNGRTTYDNKWIDFI